MLQYINIIRESDRPVHMKPAQTWALLGAAIAALCGASLSVYTYVPLASLLSCAVGWNLWRPGCGCLDGERGERGEHGELGATTANAAGTSGSDAAATSRPQQKTRSRAHWMDKLKVCLTQLVVAHRTFLFVGSAVLCFPCFVPWRGDLSLTP